ncbi:hypothetical protein C1280_02240 [Gemmata obscuriglobus]|uniref:Uncharacterized protein n=1 Tax=Gemmata obscuriglobus TaxID=114 RepID=A0A2Z3GYL1_9BACT|nr:hypothetical protein C1280_02240 [Gemmata obscuriglobus]
MLGWAAKYLREEERAGRSYEARPGTQTQWMMYVNGEPVGDERRDRLMHFLTRLDLPSTLRALGQETTKAEPQYWVNDLDEAVMYRLLQERGERPAT